MEAGVIAPAFIHSSGRVRGAVGRVNLPPMLVVVGAETLVLALLAVLVAGLLRSHARILQALHSLGVDLESHPGATAPPATSTTPVPLRLPKLSMDRPAGGPAFNITGQTATGESVSIAVLGSRVDTLIAFLSTGCTTCAGFWEALRAGAGTELPDR